MDDLMPDIDRRAMDGECAFDRIDRPDDACAEAARRTKNDFQGRFGRHIGAIQGPGHQNGRCDGSDWQNSAKELV
jgi:hypothetical protein